jgi:hypothetical protein
LFFSIQSSTTRPPYILQPTAWTKILPPHFLEARQAALLRARDYETQMSKRYGGEEMQPRYAEEQQVRYAEEQQQVLYAEDQQARYGDAQRYADEPVVAEEPGYYNPTYTTQQPASYGHNSTIPPTPPGLAARPPNRNAVPPDEFVDSALPMDEAAASRGLDPPDDEPPSLSKRAGGKDDNYDPEHFDGDDADNHYYHHSQENYYQENGENYYPTADENNYYQEEDEHYHDENNAENFNEEEKAHTDQQLGPAPTESTGDYFDEFQSPEKAVETEFEEAPRPFDARYYVTPQDQMPLSPVTENDTLSAKLSVDTEQHEDSPLASPAISAGSPSSDLPPRSPNSDFSRTSAMKGAQELLRRNRQRRLDAARKRHDDEPEGPEDEDTVGDDLVLSPRTDSESGATWESGSEMTSVVSGSSVWTDNVSNPDRSSRRALILQMAKARMRSHKSVTSPQSISEEPDEKKLEQGDDIDLTADLD